MDFTLTDEQQAVQQLFRDFAEREIRPIAAQLDEEPHFPREVFLKAGELGFFGMRHPEPVGSGADTLSYLLAVQELARGSLAVAASCTMQSLMGTYFVVRFTEGKTRERLVPAAMVGEKIGTICMTEPNAGSDLFSMTTRAEEKGDVWHLTGQKTWITSAPFADLFTVFARTGEKELSVFLVEKGAPGLTVGRSIEKMGVKASLTSEVSFEDTPATCILGSKGGGMAGLREILVEIRLMTSALALGVAQAALEDSLRYSKERVQFGKPICRFQAVQAHLADMETKLNAARALMYWASWCAQQGQNAEHVAGMSKYLASETSVEVCDRACRIMASYGYASEYPVERYLRDARFTLIGGGTSEILKVNIAREMTR